MLFYINYYSDWPLVLTCPYLTKQPVWQPTVCCYNPTMAWILASVGWYDLPEFGVLGLGGFSRWPGRPPRLDYGALPETAWLIFWTIKCNSLWPVRIECHCIYMSIDYMPACLHTFCTWLHVYALVAEPSYHETITRHYCFLSLVSCGQLQMNFPSQDF